MTDSHNRFNTHGNECVDIKEGSTNNVIEFNDCTGQRDPNSGGLNVRGNRNIVRYNKSYSNAGAGLRFGGDEQGDGVANEAYGNVFINNAGYALKVTRLPQGRLCGNVYRGSRHGFTNESKVRQANCSFSLSTPGVGSK